MAGNHLSIRLDLSNGKHIGPGKIALLEAIRAEGSILAVARRFGMSYPRAWHPIYQFASSPSASGAGA
jgi:molybdenum-dependent DNA-binding transcriptional regulator ModE